MAITNTMPVFRANYCTELTAAPHLHEGKAAKFDEEGNLALATAGGDALGVIIDPDGANVATPRVQACCSARSAVCLRCNWARSPRRYLRVRCSM